MNTLLEPRRSARDKKQRTLYTISPNDDRQTELSDEDDLSEGTRRTKSQKEKLSRTSAAKLNKTLSSKISREKMKAINEHGIDQNLGREHESLIDALLIPKSDIPSIISDWQIRFETNQHSATMEILNFLLQSCGVESIYGTPNDLIEDLDMNEIMEFVLNNLNNASDVYPLISKAKSFKHFDDAFVEFWNVVTSTCSKEILLKSNLIETCINWIIPLSSAEARAVRHTCTIAAYVIGTALAQAAKEIHTKAAVIERQEEAERKKAKTASKKLQELEEKKESYIKTKQRICSLLDSIFTGIFVHRYRDVMEDLRSESMDTLGAWIQAYPDKFLSDNYLKYLAWTLNDKNPDVREAVIQVLIQLYKDAIYYEKMELFTARFLPRYVELCEDVDVGVAHLAIQLMEAIDRANLIDAETDVESIERLIFDDRSADIRRAAASFMMLQYEAFSPIEKSENTPEAKIHDQTATQIIALVEFTEDRIGNNISLTDYVVDAFWENDDIDAVRNWLVMTQLLLDDQRQLRALQQTILLRMLFSSIRQSSLGKTNSTNKKKQLKQARAKEVEKISHVFSVVPALLKRFQSNIDQVTILIKLIVHLHLEPTGDIGQAKVFSNLLKRIKETFLNHSNLEFIESCVLTLQSLAKPTSFRSNEAQSLLQEIVEELSECLMTLLKEDDLNAHEKSDIDEEYALASTIRRLRCLNGFVDVRSTVGNEKMCDSLHNKVVLFIKKRMLNPFLLIKEDINVVQESLEFLFVQFLWDVRPLLQEAKDLDANKEEEIERLQVTVALLVERRNELVELLQQALSLHLSSAGKVELDLDPVQEKHVMDIQNSAFRIMCDIRCLCVSNLEKIDILSPLVWQPNKELISLVQDYFESQMKPQEKEQNENDNQAELSDEREDIQKALILSALAKSSLYNPQSMKEAAAVLMQLTGSGKASTAVVKAFIKELKAVAPIHYLEIQMTALRQCFKQYLLDKEDGICTDLWYFKDFSRNLAMSLGVGKVAHAIRRPFLKFLEEGIRFSLEKELNFGFLELLRPYLGHADASGIQSLSKYLKDSLGHDDTQKLKKEQEKSKDERNFEWNALVDFKKALSVSSTFTITRKSIGSPVSSISSRKSRKRSSPHSIDSNSDNVESPGELFKRQTAASVSKKARKSDLTCVPEEFPEEEEKEQDQQEEYISEPESSFLVGRRKRIGDLSDDEMTPKKRSKHSFQSTPDDE